MGLFRGDVFRGRCIYSRFEICPNSCTLCDCICTLLDPAGTKTFKSGVFLEGGILEGKFLVRVSNMFRGQVFNGWIRP